MSFRIALHSLPISLALLSCSGGGGSGGTGAPGGGGGGGGGGGIDGSWDITQAGDSKIGPSEMTISGGTVTGFVADDDEGKVVGGCTYTKRRTEFKLTFEGNAMTGSLTEVRESTGASCSSNKSEVVPITGSRASTASGATVMEGEWEIRVEDERPFVVLVSGLTAKAWDREKKLDGKEPSLSASVAGGVATVIADKDDFSFAARRR